MYRFRSFIAALLCSSLPLFVSAGDLVVIAAEGSELKPGTVVDDAQVLQLPVGAKVVLLSESGKTTTLTGPHNGVPGIKSSKQDQGVVSSLSKLLTRSEGANVMAAFRGGANKRKHQPYAIDSRKSGLHCVAAPVVLTRRSVKYEDALSIEVLATGEKATRTWSVGQSETNWPSDLAIVEGQPYRITLPLKTVEVRLRWIPEGLATDAHRAAWMADNGCERQARGVLRMLSE